MSGIAELDEMLARHHIDMTGEDVLHELDTAFAAIPGAGAAPISGPELRFLREHGGAGAAAVVDDWTAEGERQARARTAVRQLTDALAGSVSIKEAAAILGIDRSRISRRLSRNALWSFDINGSRRIPRWQFLQRDLLPGLDVIVPAIPHTANPAAVDSFMHSAQPDLDDRTPIEHLAAGGDATAVAQFLADLARW
ncbi:helix-turn-helix domain-containing protein [Mycolicibacterium sp. XJ870]